MKFFAVLVLAACTATAFAQVPNALLAPVPTAVASGSQLYRNAVTTARPVVPVRAAAQWEEMQGVVIAWNNYGSDLYPLLSDITKYAQQVARVFVVCNDSNTVKT